jgi:hypothetical protein
MLGDGAPLIEPPECEQAATVDAAMMHDSAVIVDTPPRRCAGGCGAKSMVGSSGRAEWVIRNPNTK